MRKVIIADCHPLARLGLRVALHEKIPEIETLEADCLDMAINLLADESPVELAIFALPMPDLAWPDALRDVAENYPSTRFAIFSGSGSRAEIVATLSAGLHGLVLKSQPREVVVQAFKDILADRIYVPSLMPNISTRTEWEHSVIPHAPEHHLNGNGEVSRLTPRQHDVMALLAEGYSNKDIARHLHIAEATAKIHVAAIMRSLGARNRTEAAVLIASKHPRST